ncbi:hypothetical protein ABZ915_27330 [Streptomyces sp. NPDC046915]|uniref:hypothetical protein n=1 Tax=Streptomyces sp. NPDC046915 TaxID=3155257 RepID=UPI0033D3937F
MADEQYRWLNRKAAERLLRGESLEAVDSSAREQAERLAKTLGALSADATVADTELPGEEAALAAFRKAREAREDAAAQSGAGHASGAPDGPADGGLIRIGGRPRAARRPAWARPVRLALTAALAVGTLGGVAMAAGSGVLPTPFRDETPGPAASASGTGTPDRPPASPSPDGTPGGTSGLLPPSGGASGPPGAGTSPGASRDNQARGGATGSSDPSHGAGAWWSGARSACRDIRAGRELAPDRKRVLEGVAGGSTRVWKYCKGVLESSGNTSGDGDRQGDDGHSGKGGEDGHGGRGGQNGNGGQGGGDDDGHIGPGGNDHHRQGGFATPSPTAFAPLSPQRPRTPEPPSPSPTYTAL